MVVVRLTATHCIVVVSSDGSYYVAVMGPTVGSELHWAGVQQ